MSRKNKGNQALEQVAPSSRMRVGYTIVNPTGRPIAVARPSSQIQLTPIVQPIAMVPYSTQQQPILSDMDQADY
jgi:hypothetical protein